MFIGRNKYFISRSSSPLLYASAFTGVNVPQRQQKIALKTCTNSVGYDLQEVMLFRYVCIFQSLQIKNFDRKIKKRYILETVTKRLPQAPERPRHNVLKHTATEQNGAEIPVAKTSSENLHGPFHFFHVAKPTKAKCFTKLFRQIDFVFFSQNLSY